MYKVYCFFISFLFFISYSFGKTDLLPPFIDSLYKEDQFYLRLNYLQINQVDNANNFFPYSVAGGFIVDVPFNKGRNMGMGLGLGYRFSSYGLEPILNEDNYISSGTVTKNLIRTHSVEFPIEFRWRTSTPTIFSFWRIYTGLLLEYTWSNQVTFKTEGQSYKYKNFNGIEPFKVNLTLSAGHGQWNVNTIIGLTDLIKKEYTTHGNQNTKPFSLGLIIYIL